MNVCPKCQKTKVEYYVAGYCGECAAKVIKEQEAALEDLELKKVDAVADRVNAENECCVLRGNLEAKDKRIEALEKENKQLKQDVKTAYGAFLK